MVKKIRKPSRDKDIKELNRVVQALNGLQHNPVEWSALIKLVAPIIARLASRYAVTWLASKWNKRATPKIRKELADETADRISDILSKQVK